MKLGILGGTFDPIHYAHLYMGELAICDLGLDRVIYLPNGTPPHKKNVQTSAKIRLEMTRIAVSDNPRFMVSDYEVKKEGFSYTADTLDYFKSTYPGDELYFIMGEDSLGYVEQWKDAEKLLSRHKFVVIGRGGYNIDIEGKISQLKEKYGSVFYYINAPEADISSDRIRARLRSGKTVRYLLPDRLLDYIIKNRVYG